MNLCTGKKLDKKAFFESFIKSNIIDDIINDLTKTSGLDITIVDEVGNIIISPKFFIKKSPEVLENFMEFVKKELLVIKYCNKPKRCQFSKQKNYCFVIAPIFSDEENRYLGYIIAGPYTQDLPPDSDLEFCDKIYDFYQIISDRYIDSVKNLTRSMQNIIIHVMDSYSRLIALLYEEKLSVKKHIGRLEGLHLVGNTVSGTLEMHMVLQLVLDKAIELLGAKFGSLMLLDDRKKELRILVANGLDEDIVKYTRIKVGESITGIVAQEGKSRILKKGTRYQASTSAREDSDLMAAMSVPLMLKGDIIGVLNINGHESDRDFNDGDLSLLESLASSAAIAIDNAKLYNEVQQKLRELNKYVGRLEGLYEVGKSITSTLEMQKVLQLVLDRAIELLNAENGSLMLLDKDNQELKILVANGLDEEIIKNTRIKIGESIAGSVVKDGTSKILLRGIRYNASAVDARPEDELKAGMSVPLKVKNDVIGVLNISGRDSNSNFTQEDLSLLESLASNAAAAIENARLYDEVQWKLRELSALFDLGSTIVVSLEREKVLEKVLDNAIHLLRAKFGSLMILNRDTNELEIEVAHGLSEDVINDTKIKLGEGISGRVAFEGKPRLLKKGVKEAESKSGQNAGEFPSALSVPMKFREKTIGVLNVKDKDGGDNFNNSDLELLTMLASQAAIAIENADLHKNLQDLFVNSIKALANAIEARDPYTRGHSERVTEYSVRIAEYMGMDHEEVTKIKYAALLHDIGKINIKEEILNKPGRLTDEEFRIILEHPSLGAKIMQPVKQFKEILPYMYHHHERYASGGYPDGVQGEDIPLPARILSVADSFDAMTTDRPYRKALELEEALDELKEHSGTQFDPKVVHIFLKIYENEGDWIRRMINLSHKYKMPEGDSENNGSTKNN